MEFLGFIGALLVGITLGLIGAGGSILILPILVYLLKVSPIEATGYSLLIVGITSLFGAYNYYKQGNIDLKIGLIFSFPAFLGVFIARAFIVPLLPEVIYEGSFILNRDTFILLFFSIIMGLASVSMIRGRKNKDNSIESESVKYNYPLIGFEGLIVGSATGLVGAGGGFLIIPALVVLAKLPMKKAIGTSLFIISIKSLFGLLGDYKNFENYNGQLLLIFTILSILGVFLGSFLGKKVPGRKLKPAFGYFVFLMALYIVGKEVL